MAIGGENVGRVYVEMHADGDSVPGDIEDGLDKMTPKFKEYGEKHGDAYSEGFNDRAEKGSDDFAEKIAEDNRGILAGYDKIKSALGGVREKLFRNRKETEDNDESTRRWLDRFHQRLIKVNEALDDSAERTGRMFGKGSRNDFLNVIGSAIEGLDRLIITAPKAAENLTRIFTGGGGGGTTDWAKIATNVASGFAGIVIGLVALVSIAGPAAALVNGLAAGVVALAGSLVFAAGAVGGVALALTGPLAAAIGVVVAALVGMDDQTRKTIFNSIDPLAKRISRAGDAAGEAFGPKLAKAVAALQPALRGIDGFFASVGDSLGTISINLAEATQSRGFKDFQAAFADFIPGALEDLGQIAQGTLGGIGGIMRAAIPITQEFLGWLKGITDEFSEWANSVRGQRQLTGFFDDAADSAKAIGDFLAEAVKALAHLLDAGRETGDSLFRQMADQLERFTNYLTDPTNKAAIKDFFANGVEVAQELGGAILDIADALGDLDTPEARKFLAFLFDAFGAILGLIGDVAHIADSARNTVVGAFGAVADAAGTVKDSVQDAYRGVRGFFQKIPDMAEAAVDGVERWFSKLPGRVVSAVRTLPGKVDAITDKVAYNAGLTVGRAVRWFAGMPGKVASAIASLPSRASAIFQRAADKAISVSADIVSWFTKLPSKIESGIGDLWGTIRGKFDKVVDGVDGLVDDIVDGFRGLAGKILGAIGTIDIGSLIRLPGGKIGQAAEGFLNGIRGDAAGDIVLSPRLGWTGEAGPEAIVPLDRPLSQVNPNVRGLSAIAQGLASPGGGGRVLNVHEGAVKVYEVADGRATAAATLNQLVARLA